MSIAFLTDNFFLYNYGFYLILFFYYFILELLFKKTLGKMVTKTKVVKKNGGKASFMNILLRTSARFIPFDIISYAFGTERGMHDVLSSTKLI